MWFPNAARRVRMTFLWCGQNQGLDSVSPIHTRYDSAHKSSDLSYSPRHGIRHGTNDILGQPQDNWDAPSQVAQPGGIHGSPPGYALPVMPSLSADGQRLSLPAPTYCNLAPYARDGSPYTADY